MIEESRLACLFNMKHFYPWFQILNFCSMLVSHSLKSFLACISYFRLSDQSPQLTWSFFSRSMIDLKLGPQNNNIFKYLANCLSGNYSDFSKLVLYWTLFGKVPAGSRWLFLMSISLISFASLKIQYIKQICGLIDPRWIYV